MTCSLNNQASKTHSEGPVDADQASEETDGETAAEPQVVGGHAVRPDDPAALVRWGGELVDGLPDGHRLTRLAV